MKLRGLPMQNRAPVALLCVALLQMAAGYGVSLLQEQSTGTITTHVPTIPALPTTPAEHCLVANGTWCGPYYSQTPQPVKPIPRGNKPCPNDCSGVGVCHYDFGICYCPAGYGGEDCSAPRKRPCWRMGEDKRDLDWHKYTEWTHSRCAGICDDDIAMCYCPPETKFGHIPAPEGSPLGTPPVKLGRPLYWCQPSSDKEGNPVKWGAVSYQDLFGPDGWCNNPQSKWQCPCRIDGVTGLYCNIAVEMFCINQCSGHGHCDQGFCKCHNGYYGGDCSRRRLGMPLEEGDQFGPKPWLINAITPVITTEEPPVLPVRKRPYVYVYDIKPEYFTDILQYRIERGHCSYRTFGSGNRSEFIGYNGYAAETALQELFLTSEHRTFDPEEADFFFVPTMAGCLFDVYGWNPIPMWPAGLHGSRPFGSAMMMRAAAQWINNTFPWFSRHGGRDHIWHMPHDEGACYAMTDIWPGVIISHWGRMDQEHVSASQYHADNYSLDFRHAEIPDGWLHLSSKAHPCFDPSKDLVLPTFKQPTHFSSSPYLGAQPKERDILVFFRGEVGRGRPSDTNCQYSRCIRQTLLNLSKSQQWKEKYNAMYGDNSDVPGLYSDLLSRSKFCLALPGDGYSARFEDGALHGCIPVIVMDNVQLPFENMLDFSKFTLRVAEKDMDKLIDIVAAVPPEKVKELQENLARVWMRFRYTGLILTNKAEEKIIAESKARNGGHLPPTPGVQFAGQYQDSVFDTVMQFLYSKIPAIHGHY